jgi:hypothetical protein
MVYYGLIRKIIVYVMGGERCVFETKMESGERQFIIGDL